MASIGENEMPWSTTVLEPNQRITERIAQQALFKAYNKRQALRQYERDLNAFIALQPISAASQLEDEIKVQQLMRQTRDDNDLSMFDFDSNERTYKAALKLYAALKRVLKRAEAGAYEPQKVDNSRRWIIVLLVALVAIIVYAALSLPSFLASAPVSMKPVATPLTPDAPPEPANTYATPLSTSIPTASPVEDTSLPIENALPTSTPKPDQTAAKYKEIYSRAQSASSQCRIGKGSNAMSELGKKPSHVAFTEKRPLNAQFHGDCTIAADIILSQLDRATFYETWGVAAEDVHQAVKTTRDDFWIASAPTTFQNRAVAIHIAVRKWRDGYNDMCAVAVGGYTAKITISSQLLNAQRQFGITGQDYISKYAQPLLEVCKCEALRMELIAINNAHVLNLALELLTPPPQSYIW